MMRSLYSAVSGLKTHQTRMDVIGNNIANVNTEAFKASQCVSVRLCTRLHRALRPETEPPVPVEKMQSR